MNCLSLNSLLDLGRVEVDCIAADLFLGLHTNVHVLKMFHHEIFLLEIAKHMPYVQICILSYNRRKTVVCPNSQYS